MLVLRSVRGAMPMAAILVLSAASPVFAQTRQLFEWAGPVDREIQIAMRGNDVWTRGSYSNEADRSSSRVRSELPRNDGEVMVRLHDGRGSAEVIQQPSARNNYTTIVRIRDASGGADRYHISAYWRPAYDNGNDWPNYPRQPRVESRDRDDWEDDDRGGWGGVRDREELRRWGARGMLRWSGRVDGELEIRIRGNDVDYRTLSGQRPRSVSARMVGRNLNRSTREVRIREESGRGRVVVVQQPNRRNDYTAIIRVTDRPGGYGYYDFDVVWR